MRLASGVIVHRCGGAVVRCPERGRCLVLFGFGGGRDEGLWCFSRARRHVVCVVGMQLCDAEC